MEYRKYLDDIIGFSTRTEKNENKNLIVKPFRMGCSVKPKDFFVKRGDNYPYFLIHFIFSGTATITTGGKEHHLKKGDAFLIAPNEPHLYVTNEETGYLWLELDFFNYKNVVSELKNHHVLDATHTRALLTELVDIVKYAKTSEKISEYILSAKAYSIIMTIYNEIITLNDDPIQSYIKLAINFIDTHYRESITLADVCKVANVSESLITRKFRQATGTSIKKYIIAKKLEYAVFLLQHSKYTCDEIVGLAGFYDLSHLNRLCKSYLNKNPTEIRKKL